MVYSSTSMIIVSKCGQLLRRAGIACHPRPCSLQTRNNLSLLNTGIDSVHRESSGYVVTTVEQRHARKHTSQERTSDQKKVQRWRSQLELGDKALRVYIYIY